MSAGDLTGEDYDSQLAFTKQQIDTTFDRVHDALRLVSTFSRTDSDSQGVVEADLRPDVQTVLDDLVDDAPVDAIYIITDPTGGAGNPAFGAGKSMVIFGSHGLPPSGAALGVMQTEAAALRDGYPTAESAASKKIPALSGAESGDSYGTDIVYSVPFYDQRGNFRGIVSTIIPADALRDMLNGPCLALVHPSTGYCAMQPQTNAKMNFAINILRHGTVPDGFPYARLVQSDIADATPWDFGELVPAEVFYATHDFENARQQTRTLFVGGMSVVVLLSAIFWLLATSRYRALGMARMTHDLAAAKVSAESANKAKSEFLAP